MTRLRRILGWLTLTFLAAVAISAMFGGLRLMAGLIYLLAPVAIAYLTLALLRYMGKYADPRPLPPVHDPYWPPSRSRDGARR